jgi:cytochrome c
MQASRTTLASLMVAALAACSSDPQNGHDEQRETTPPAAAVAAADEAGRAPASAASSDPVVAVPAQVASDRSNATAASSAASETATAPKAAVVAPAAFAQCRSCHAVEPGQNRIGPSLAGVFGAKAGHVGSYNYSTALKNSGLTWDEASLDGFLKSPREKLPGTKMTFPGVKNDAARAEVILYLKAL